MSFSANALKEKARELGFNMVGITPAVPSPTLAAYRQWVEAGMHSTMQFMSRPDRQERREDLNRIVQGAASIIMVGLDYRTAAISEDLLTDPTRGRIASYAWGVDYHDLMTPSLEELAAWINAQTGGNQKVYVDTGAVLERSHAQQAGMGFIGKNTMLIHPKRGSYFFLGEIISSIEFDEYDEAHRENMCGKCTRCMDACPTDAFPKPHVLDARLCISYHTIENRGWIDRKLRSKFGNWVFGCDICQEVCPFQRFSPITNEADFLPMDENRAAPHLATLLTMDEDTFQSIYAGSPVERIKRVGMVRNAVIAAGNSKDKQFIPYVIPLLYDAEPLVRGHAAWALLQIMKLGALKQLYDMDAREDDPEVKAELAAITPK